MRSTANVEHGKVEPRLRHTRRHGKIRAVGCDAPMGDDKEQDDENALFGGGGLHWVLITPIIALLATATEWCVFFCPNGESDDD